MATTLAQLADLVGGRLIGEGITEIRGAATLDDAQSGEITLIDGPEKTNLLAQAMACAVVAPTGTDLTDLPSIEVDDVHRAFTQIVKHFRPSRERSRIGIHPTAIIDETVVIGNDVDVHPHATIGAGVHIGDGSTIGAGVHIMENCRIGSGVTILPNAVLYENSIVGDHVLIHAGAVIGSYGFGYGFEDGRHVLSAQLGHVEIGDHVEIGANSTIDRGTYGPTTIGEGTKIDNMVQIAHNCRIGRHNMLCAQVGIAGSSSTGDYVVMAGQAGVRDHVHVGDRVVLGAKSGVSNDVKDDEVAFGIPATPQREQKLKLAAIAKLPEMRREFKAMKRVVARLEQTGKDNTPAAA